MQLAYLIEAERKVMEVKKVNRATAANMWHGADADGFEHTASTAYSVAFPSH